MNKSSNLKVSLVAVASLLLVATASAATIGPWPASTSTYWDSQPLLPSNASSIGGDGHLWTPAIFTGGAGKLVWLPYPSFEGEKSSLAKLILDPGDAVASVHTRVYDPWTTGRTGWAIVLEDSSGRLFDFGIRVGDGPTIILPGKIVPKAYDGSAWEYPLAGGSYQRSGSGAQYYVFDFTRNGNGTMSWAVDANADSVPDWTGTTVTTYGDITGVYLNAMADGNSGATVTYKWTDFSYALVPEPSTGLTLGAGFLALTCLVRRKRV